MLTSEDIKNLTCKELEVLLLKQHSCESILIAINKKVIPVSVLLTHKGVKGGVVQNPTQNLRLPYLDCTEG